jgi:hypothetical protein
MRQTTSTDPHRQKTVNDCCTAWFPLRWWRHLKQWFAKNEESGSTPAGFWHPAQAAGGSKQLDNDSSVTLRPGELP